MGAVLCVSYFILITRIGYARQLSTFPAISKQHRYLCNLVDKRIHCFNIGSKTPMPQIR